MGEKIEALPCDTSEGACQRKKEMATRKIRRVKEVKDIGKHRTLLPFPPFSPSMRRIIP